MRACMNPVIFIFKLSFCTYICLSNNSHGFLSAILCMLYISNNFPPKTNTKIYLREDFIPVSMTWTPFEWLHKILDTQTILICKIAVVACAPPPSPQLTTAMKNITKENQSILSNRAFTYWYIDQYFLIEQSHTLEYFMFTLEYWAVTWGAPPPKCFCPWIVTNKIFDIN